MIILTDKLNNKLIEFNYKTYYDKYSAEITATFKIKYISENYNGEFIYVTKDDIDQQVVLYRTSYDEEFQFFDMSKTSKNTTDIYTYIGSFIAMIKECTDIYNKTINIKDVLKSNIGVING